MKKIDFTMSFTNIQQPLDKVFNDMLDFHKQYLQDAFVCEHTVLVRFLTAKKNIKNGMVNLKGRTYPIIEVSKNYDLGYKDKYVEFYLPIVDLPIMKDLVFTSEEIHDNPDAFDLTWLNVSFKEWYKYQWRRRSIEKQHGLFKLNLDIREEGIALIQSFIMNESDTNKDLMKKWLFYYLDKYQPHCSFDSLKRFYPTPMTSYSIYEKRMAIEWFTFLPAEILPEEVPSANEVIYISSFGSIIISTEQPYDFENLEMRKVAANIEQELHHLGLLPIIDRFNDPQLQNCPFISREQRLKNRSKRKPIESQE